MLVRTVVTECVLGRREQVAKQMVTLGLAQNVESNARITGDWVEPELLGLSCESYMIRHLNLQHDNKCVAHIEVC